MVNPLYTVEKECPICQDTFMVTKVRSRLTMVSQDSDFCTYYQEVNPNYYAVWVCPHCGYAGQEAYFNDLSVTAKDKLRKFLAGKQVNVNFSGERTAKQAIATYKLAIYYAEVVGLPASRLGGLYLKLAWIYREAGCEEEEQAALSKARENYEQVFFKERFPVGNLTELTLEYLVGDLFRRTGQYDQALLYLGKVISNPHAKAERRILELARESWYQAKEAKKQLNKHDDQPQ